MPKRSAGRSSAPQPATTAQDVSVSDRAASRGRSPSADTLTPEQKAPLFGASTASNPFAALGSTPAPPTSNAASPFSFGVAAAPAPKADAAKSTAPSFNFANPAPSAASSSFSFSAPKPSEAQAMPSTTPSFSFGATSAFGKSSFGSSAPAPTPAAAPPPAKTERAQSPALSYYTSLRAINVSLLDNLAAAIEKDPFVDLTADAAFDKLKEKYKTYRNKVQSEYDGSRGKTANSSADTVMDVEKSAPETAKPASAPAFEIPEIFGNPPKPVPIADLSEEAEKTSVPASTSASISVAPKATAFEIPDIFKNPPKPVPIADLTEEAPSASTSSSSSSATVSSAPKSMAPTVAESEIPAIFRNPPKPVPIADLTEEEEDKSKRPPAPPAVFSFAGSAVSAAPSSSSAAAPATSGGFVFKADSSASSGPKSAFSFPPATSSPSASPSTTTSSAPASTSSTTEPNSSKSASNRDELKPPSAPKLAPAKLTNPPSKPSPLRFGQSASPPTSPEKPGEAAAPKPKGGFSFGAQFGGIAKGEAAKKAENEAEEQEKTTEAGAEAKAGEASQSVEAPAKPAFSFGSSPAATSGSPFSFGASAPSTASSPFSFGAAASKPATETASKPVPFTFGAAQAKPDSPSAASGAAGSPPAPFGFGAALGGSDGSKSASGRSAGFGFGSTIGSPGGSGPTASGAPATTLTEKDQPAKSSFGFSFGAAQPAASSGAKPTPSFSFAPVTSASTEAPTGEAETAKPAAPFTFAPPAPISTNGAAAGGGESTAPSEAATDSRAQTPGANPFTAPGEGEEGEETLFATRAKVWELKGVEADLLGVANVQLKEKDGAVRMLARHETNGRVLVVRSLPIFFCLARGLLTDTPDPREQNFRLYSSLNLKREKVFATFIGFDAQAERTTYRLRFKSVEVLGDFDDALTDAKKKLPS